MTAKVNLVVNSAFLIERWSSKILQSKSSQMPQDSNICYWCTLPAVISFCFIFVLEHICYWFIETELNPMFNKLYHLFWSKMLYWLHSEWLCLNLGLIIFSSFRQAWTSVVCMRSLILVKPYNLFRQFWRRKSNSV